MLAGALAAFSLAAVAAAGSGSLRVVLEMPSLDVHPGDDFYLRSYLDNPDGPDLLQVPVVFALEAAGELFFWPSWTGGSPPGAGFDFLHLDVPRGTTAVTVLPAMVWPETGAQSVRGLRFYGAMLTSEMDGLRGEMGIVEWGFGPPSDLAIDPLSALVLIGGTQEFTLTGGLAPFVWELSDPEVGDLEVAPSGRAAVFTALVEGRVTLNVTGGDGYQAIAEIEVACPPIDVLPAGPTVRVGETLQFSASGGLAPYRWESSFIFAGQIDASGLFLAGPLTGTTRLTAYDASGCSGRTDVLVIP